MPSPTVGRITTRAAFAELQRSRARGSSGSVRAVFVPASSPSPNPAAADGQTPSAPRAPTWDLPTHGPSSGPAPPRVRARRTRASGSSGEPFPQVGYAVSRRCGSAVVRNRLRRRARAVVRDEAAASCPGAVTCSVSPLPRPRLLRPSSGPTWPRPSTGPPVSRRFAADDHDCQPASPPRPPLRRPRTTSSRCPPPDSASPGPGGVHCSCSRPIKALLRAGCRRAVTTRAAPTTPLRPSPCTASGGPSV